MLKARRRAFPVKVCGGYKGSPSLPLKGDELLKTALPLPPPSSLALSTALLIQWGGVVRKAPTRCAQMAKAHGRNLHLRVRVTEERVSSRGSKTHYR